MKVVVTVAVVVVLVAVVNVVEVAVTVLVQSVGRPVGVGEGADVGRDDAGAWVGSLMLGV